MNRCSIEDTLQTKQLRIVSEIHETFKGLVLKVRNRFERFQVVKVIMRSKFREKELTFLKDEKFDGVIELQESFIDSSYQYLVFDYYSNNLFVGATKNPSRRTKIRWVQCLLSTFVKLQERNVMHGDIKPQNVLLDSSSIEKSIPIVIDLGAAKNIEAPGNIQFTLKYAAPELIKDLKVSIKSDVWSFGQLILFIFTLKVLAFKETEEDNLIELKKICQGDLELLNIVSKCFYLDYEKRPTFKELGAYLFFKSSKREGSQGNKKIDEMQIKAIRTIVLLKYRRPAGLRKIWVNFVHRPVINCVLFYLKRKFENIKNRFLNENQEKQMREVECKILQYTSTVEDFSDIIYLENLCRLYESCDPLNELDEELRKVLKSTLKCIKNSS